METETKDIIEALRALHVAALVGAQALRSAGCPTAASYLEQRTGNAETALRDAGVKVGA